MTEQTTLAIDIGGTKFTVAIFRSDKMVRRESRATNREGGREWLLAELAPLLRSWSRETALDNCGIGFGGPVDFARQIVATSTHVGGWRDFDLVQVVRQIVGVPVVMDNDANAGVAGEFLFGAGRGCDPLFYMTLSTGIGGGVIVNGRVLRGVDSWAGEVGHVNVRPDGPACLCGSNGCLERMCCGLWLEHDHGSSARELMQHPEFVREYVVDLARGLKTVLMILNPARIVIGGGIAKSGPALFDPLDRELRKQMPAWSRARTDVAPAALGDDSVVYGAMALARRIM